MLTVGRRGATTDDMAGLGSIIRSLTAVRAAVEDLQDAVAGFAGQAMDGQAPEPPPNVMLVVDAIVSLAAAMEVSIDRLRKEYPDLGS